MKTQPATFSEKEKLHSVHMIALPSHYVSPELCLSNDHFKQKWFLSHSSFAYDHGTHVSSFPLTYEDNGQLETLVGE